MELSMLTNLDFTTLFGGFVVITLLYAGATMALDIHEKKLVTPEWYQARIASIKQAYGTMADDFVRDGMAKQLAKGQNITRGDVDKLIDHFISLKQQESRLEAQARNLDLQTRAATAPAGISDYADLPRASAQNLQ